MTDETTEAKETAKAKSMRKAGDAGRVTVAKIAQNPRANAIYALVAGSIADLPVVDGFVPAVIAGASAFLQTLDKSI